MLKKILTVSILFFFYSITLPSASPLSSLEQYHYRRIAYAKWQQDQSQLISELLMKLSELSTQNSVHQTLGDLLDPITMLQVLDNLDKDLSENSQRPYCGCCRPKVTQETVNQDPMEFLLKLATQTDLYRQEYNYEAIRHPLAQDEAFKQKCSENMTSILNLVDKMLTLGWKQKFTSVGWEKNIISVNQSLLRRALGLKDNGEIAKKLLDHGVTLEPDDLAAKHPYFLLAARFKQDKYGVFQQVLDQTPQASITQTNLDEALAVTVDPSIASLLIKKGANVTYALTQQTKVDRLECRTTFHEIHFQPNLEVLKLLKESIAPKDR